MTRSSHGFTLIELSIAGTCLTITIGALYGLGYQVRLQQRIGEVDLRLAREAALVDMAWRRDARSAKAATAPGEGSLVAFSISGQSPGTTWRVEKNTMLRRDAEGEAPLCNDVASAVASREGANLVLDLTLSARVGDLERREAHRFVARAPEAFR